MQFTQQPEPMSNPISRWRDRLPLSLLILWILAQVGLVVAYKLDFHELFFPKQTEIELHGVEYKLYEEISPCSSDFASFEKCNYMAVEQCYRNSDNCRTIRCNDCVELFIENGKPMAHLENGSVIEVHRALD